MDSETRLSAKGLAKEEDHEELLLLLYGAILSVWLARLTEGEAAVS